MKKRHFQSGQRPTFRCDLCERMTRDTGQGVDHLCEACFEISSLDNQANDSGELTESMLQECNAWLSFITKRGGNIARVQAHNRFIWPKAEVTESALPTAAYIAHWNAWFWIEKSGSGMLYFGPYGTEQDARQRKDKGPKGQSLV